MSGQYAAKPGREVATVSRPMVGLAEGDEAAPVELKPAPGGGLQIIEAEAKIVDAVTKGVGARA